MRLSILGYVALILVIIGGINWGLIGLFNFNLVEFLFRTIPVLIRVTYILVGVCAIYLVFAAFKKTRAR